MNIFSLIGCCSFLFSFSIFAANIHKVGTGINYHLDQDKSPGAQFSYQWQFHDSVEFASHYFSNDSVKLITDDEQIVSSFDHFTIGGNFLKRYNKELSIKAGVGLSMVTASSNELVVKKNALAPYVLIGAAYQLTDNLTIEAGQVTHFNNQILDTNHNIFFSINYQFDFYSPKPSRTQVDLLAIKKKHPNEAAVTVKEKPIVKIQNAAKPIQAKVAEIIEKPLKLPTKQSNAWYIQFGVFINESNAISLKNTLQTVYPNLTIELIKKKQMFHVISQSFATKQRAQDFINNMTLADDLNGYVTQFTF